MATNPVEQVQQLIRRTLLANSAVVALVADRVLGHHLWTPDDGSVPMPLVIVEVSGGDGHYSRHLQKTDLSIWCYSKISAAQAASLYDLVYAALQQQRLAVTGITIAGLARETGRPEDAYNSEIGAWYRLGKWRATTAG